jgi:hypothetical protein
MYQRNLGCGSCSGGCDAPDPCASPAAASAPSSPSLWGYVFAGLLGAILFGGSS